MLEGRETLRTCVGQRRLFDGAPVDQRCTCFSHQDPWIWKASCSPTADAENVAAPVPLREAKRTVRDVEVEVRTVASTPAWGIAATRTRVVPFICTTTAPAFPTLNGVGLSGAGTVLCDAVTDTTVPASVAVGAVEGGIFEVGPAVVAGVVVGAPVVGGAVVGAAVVAGLVVGGDVGTAIGGESMFAGAGASGIPGSGCDAAITGTSEVPSAADTSSGGDHSITSVFVAVIANCCGSIGCETAAGAAKALSWTAEMPAAAKLSSPTVHAPASFVILVRNSTPPRVACIS